MQRTSSDLFIRVGDDKVPLRLTDSAVEAVQDEAAGKMVDAMAAVWAIEKTIDGGESFATLDLNQLIELRDNLRSATELAEVLIECRPLDELDTDD